MQSVRRKKKVRDRTIALVTEATGKPCPQRRTEASALTLAPPTANAAVGQVVAYTVGASSKDAGHTVTVAVDGPAVLSDANGTSSGQQQQQVTLDVQSAATFWVLSTARRSHNVMPMRASGAIRRHYSCIAFAST